jgi:hypothetical protein
MSGRLPYVWQAPPGVCASPRAARSECEGAARPGAHRRPGAPSGAAGGSPGRRTGPGLGRGRGGAARPPGARPPRTAPGVHQVPRGHQRGQAAHGVPARHRATTATQRRPPRRAANHTTGRPTRGHPRTGPRRRQTDHAVLGQHKQTFMCGAAPPRGAGDPSSGDVRRAAYRRQSSGGAFPVKPGARNAVTMDDMRCPHCGGPLAFCAACGSVLPAPARTGRPRVYCSDECRYRMAHAARGRRRAGRPLTAGQLVAHLASLAPNSRTVARHKAAPPGADTPNGA